MNDRDCPRNHDEPLYRRITDGFLEMPVDFCPACGKWVCTDGTPAPVEPPVLSRAAETREASHDYLSLHAIENSASVPVLETPPPRPDQPFPEADDLEPYDEDDEETCNHDSTSTDSEFLEWCDICGERVDPIGAPVEPVPASEIVKLRHVIEEARAIAWDLYENPWEIPDAARDEISDLHNLLARAIDRSAPVPAPPSELTRDALADAMNEAFAEFCADTGCAPDCFQIHGPRTTSLSADFHIGNFVKFVVDILSRDSPPVPAPRLSKGELVEIWCKAQYDGRLRELIALHGPESPYVEMYEGGWETCDRASKESYRRSATYIIDALENVNAVLSPPVGTQEKEN